MHRLLVLAALLVALPAGAVEIEWMYIGDPGNPADTELMVDETSGFGSVPYAYWISKCEITNARFAELLNAVAKTDPVRRYGEYGQLAGIARSGSPGSYTYSVMAGFENKPAVFSI